MRLFPSKILGKFIYFLQFCLKYPPMLKYAYFALTFLIITACHRQISDSTFEPVPEGIEVIMPEEDFSEENWDEMSFMEEEETPSS